MSAAHISVLYLQHGDTPNNGKTENTIDFYNEANRDNSDYIFWQHRQIPHR